MARSRRRNRRSKGSAWQVLAACALVAACVAILGGYGWLMATAEKAPELVAETLCPVDGPQSVTVVLLDASDDIPAVGRRQLKTLFGDIADGMPEYGMLELRLLDPAVPGGRVVFSKCNPGDGANLSELVANPAAARKRWTEAFRKPLNDSIDEGLAASKSETSPIMETIQNIAVERFDGKAAEGVDKKLYVVSDMIEHGPAYSQYKAGLSYEAFAKLPARKAFATDLHGAEVHVQCVQRASSKFDTNDFVAFWEKWVDANGGHLAEFEKVQGAG